MARRRDVPKVVLHVGLPKSGTTFLQRSLAVNAPALGDRGVLYPDPAGDLMFRAALDVRGSHKAWGRSRAEVTGAWDELCARAREFTGTTVVSHELLAGACRRQVVAATTMLKELDVHVVLTPSTSWRPRLPLSLYDAVAPVSEHWVKEIQQAGYAVHGDLANLVPVAPKEEYPHPDRVAAENQVEVAAHAIAELLLDLDTAESRADERDEKRRSWKKQTKKLRVRLAELTG